MLPKIKKVNDDVFLKIYSASILFWGVTSLINKNNDDLSYKQYMHASPHSGLIFIKGGIKIKIALQRLYGENESTLKYSERSL